MKNRISSYEALFHKWIQVCGWIIGGKFIFNVHKTQKRIEDPVKQSMIKAILWKFNFFCWKATNIDVSKVTTYRSSHLRCSLRKDVLRDFAKFTGKPLCQSFFFNKVAGLSLFKKETLPEVFSCKFCEISKNTFFTKHP